MPSNIGLCGRMSGVLGDSCSVAISGPGAEQLPVMWPPVWHQLLPFRPELLLHLLCSACPTHLPSFQLLLPGPHHVTQGWSLRGVRLVHIITTGQGLHPSAAVSRASDQGLQVKKSCGVLQRREGSLGANIWVLDRHLQIYR